jgi:GUN4-like
MTISAGAVVFIQEELEKTGANYSRLRSLLAEGDWREADIETMDIILKVSGRTAEGYPKPSDIKNIPAADLEEIDTLWRRYSQGKFGFTPQKQFWFKASQNYTEFCESIHWHKDDAWLDYSGLNFSIDAVAGHLPALMFPCPLGDSQVCSFALGSWRVALLNR